ncbi:hypothetical protein [Streptomyces atacamensis]|uniref:hypothetical protein n=1 Tax=Streptomyces atacamensis TaxID=531966 RepID=UPI00399CE179
MANLVYKRVSTDQQSAARQNLVPNEAGIEDPAVHLGLLARCRPLDGAWGAPAVPAQRKARREYEDRVTGLGAPA